jgi:two-component system nitrogen regulation response regulator NtrX
VQLDADTIDALRAFDWPGNVRQLRNAIERMVVLAPGSELGPALLPPEIRPSLEEVGSSSEGESPWKAAVLEAKLKILREALARNQGNQTRTAADLGLQRTYLNRLLKDHGVE